MSHSRFWWVMHVSLSSSWFIITLNEKSPGICSPGISMYKETSTFPSETGQSWYVILKLEVSLHDYYTMIFLIDPSGVELWQVSITMERGFIKGPFGLLCLYILFSCFCSFDLLLYTNDHHSSADILGSIHTDLSTF